MKLYFWAETHIIAKSIKRAKELLENDGLDQGRFPIEYQGDDDYIMQLYDINKEENVDITVGEYAKRFGETLIYLD